MHVIETARQMQLTHAEHAGHFRDNNDRQPVTGLTPTMGALHAGHLSLIKRMTGECDISIVSVFVNPLQFNERADFDRYPQTPDEDLKMCEQAGVDYVFMPGAGGMYPGGHQTTVSVGGLTKLWCGASRPGHFDGVTTVVSKLFNCCRPDRAYFGEKDFQQLAVINRMVTDLNMPVTIIPCPLVRERDGLAMSSRNQRLNAEERRAAPDIYCALWRMQGAFSEGVTDAAKLVAVGRDKLAASKPGFRIDYLTVVDPVTLEPRETAKVGDRILVAAWLGDVRLIDNVALIEQGRMVEM